MDNPKPTMTSSITLTLSKRNIAPIGKYTGRIYSVPQKMSPKNSITSTNEHLISTSPTNSPNREFPSSANVMQRSSPAFDTISQETTNILNKKIHQLEELLKHCKQENYIIENIQVSKLNNANQRAKKAEEEILKLKLIIKQKDFEYTKQKNRNDKDIDQLILENNVQNDTIKQLKELNNSFSSNLNELSENFQERFSHSPQIDKLKEQIIELESLNDKIQFENGSFKSSIESINNENQIYKEESKVLRMQIEEMGTSMEELNNKIFESDILLNELKESKEQELGEANEILENKQNEIDQLSNKLKEALEMNNKIQNLVEESTNEKEQLQQIIEEKDTQIDQIQESQQIIEQEFMNTIQELQILRLEAQKLKRLETLIEEETSEVSQTGRIKRLMLDMSIVRSENMILKNKLSNNDRSSNVCINK